MFAAFDIDINLVESYVVLSKGKEIEERHKHEIKQKFNQFINDDGSVNATKVQNEWFPNIKADIFISHSSKDVSKARLLAGYLKSELGLESFIDSSVWGYCDDLLKKIDNKYCYREYSKTYDYTTRNYTTSHVHNMLSVALNSMIDRCECIFFINSMNSITTEDIKTKTESPWIYNELSTIKTIRKKVPSYHGIKHEFAEKRAEINDSLPSFYYDVDLTVLTKLSDEDYKKWIEQAKGHAYPLKYLYDMKLKRNIIIS